MADFNSDLQSFKPSFPYLDNIDYPNMELMSQFAHSHHILHPSLLEPPSSNMNLQTLLGFSNEIFFNPQQQQQQQHQVADQFPGSLLENFPAIFQLEDVKNVIPIPLPLVQSDDHIQNGNCFENKKRKAMDISECSSGNSSTPPGSETTGIETVNNSGKGKRIKGNHDKEKGMPKEVVHVRARRGQATDSHSLAERVRRGKINERLRCLQDIVPGCYKTMGMAVMLDEIINYVQSLQNQVEFLSMKLTAASSYYDFSSETEAIEALQMAKANEALKVQRVYDQQVGCTQVGPLDLSFGTYPSLPYNSS